MMQEASKRRCNKLKLLSLLFVSNLISQDFNKAFKFILENNYTYLITIISKYTSSWICGKHRRLYSMRICIKRF